MISLAIKKILNNKVLMLSLFSGILIAVIIACTIPIYSAGISHRMFVTQMENYQNEKNISPGSVIISCSLTSFKQTSNDSDSTVTKNDSSANELNFNYCTDYLNNTLYKQMNMPAIVKGITLSTGTLKAGDSRDKLKNSVCDIVVKATEKYENAVEIVDGQLPKQELNDGCVEVMISRATQQNTCFTLGSVIQVGSSEADILNDYTEDILSLKIVGIYEYKVDSLNPIVDSENGNEFYCDYNQFYENIFKKRNLVSKSTWYFAGDYTKFDLTKTDTLIAGLEQLNKNIVMWGLDGNVTTVTPPIEQYKAYSSNIKSVNILLVLFYAPIMILIVFFIFMISKFVVENDKNEISMLTSRGASRFQILLLYLCQGGLFALISIIIAPVLALILCSLLGSTSGFLEFAQRAPMKIRITGLSILFCVVAGFLSVITMLIPVNNAAKLEIVQQKRNKHKSTLLGKIGFIVATVVMGIVSFYSYYVLVIQKEGLITEAGNVQPLAYLLLICFFAFVAMFFVLLYPFVLKFFTKISQKHWTASKFSAFSRIGRMEDREKFIIIFITLTVAIGMFSSISARTLNKNMDSSTRYQYPCDLIADVKFSALNDNQYIQRKYFFDDIVDTDAMKVIVGNSPRLNTRHGKSITDNLKFMGIDPDKFGNIVTWDNSILPKNLDYYLSLIKNDPTGCIISKNAAKALGKVEVGESIYVIPDTGSKYMRGVAQCRILAIVDAWPTYYSSENDEFGFSKENYLVVVNGNSLDRIAKDEPYQVWMNTNQDINFFKSLSIKNGARFTNIVNGAREVYLSKINAVRQATNGSLTLGFIAVIIVCAIGFSIYWVISIKSRTLHIGTMRALGMSYPEVNKMIVWEQILLCGCSVVLGLIAGVVSGIMFSPLLQSAFSKIGDMPPYKVSIQIFDTVKLLVLVALLIVVGTVVARKMLKHIKASSAIKLGEE